METWTIAVIVIGCAAGLGLLVGIPLYVIMDRKRKRRGNEDPFAISESQQDEHERAQWGNTLGPSQPVGNATATGAGAGSALDMSDLRQLSSQQQAMLNAPYQRFSLNIGGPTRLFVGRAYQPAVPARGPSYFPSYRSSQPDLVNVPVPANAKTHKNGKHSKPDPGFAVAGYANPAYGANSHPPSFPYQPGPSSFLSDLPLTREPMFYQRRPQPQTALRTEPDRKDLHRWHSSSNLGEPPDFADAPYLPRLELDFADGRFRPSKSMRPDAELALNASRLAQETRASAPGGIRLATELRDMRGPLNALDAAAAAAAGNSRRPLAPANGNGPVVVPAVEVADTDLLVFGRRGASEPQTNWQTRARENDVAPLSVSEAPAKPLARIPPTPTPTPTQTEAVYSKANKGPKTDDKEKDVEDLKESKAPGGTAKRTRSQQDLQSVTDMFGFLDVMTNT